MATFAATRCTQKIQELYDRTVDGRKTKKTALVACMQKQLVIMNVMVKNEPKWDPERQAPSA